MAVSITLAGPTQSGGSGGDQISTNEYTNSTAAVAAVTNGFLPVLSPTSGGKAQHVSVARIVAIVSL